MSNEENGVERGAENAPVPEYSGGSEPVAIHLPVGSIDLDRQLFKSPSAIPLNGVIRKKIGRPDILAHPGKLVTSALIHVLSFPHFQFKDPKAEKKLTIRSMYSADRSACVLRVRELTKGQEPITQVQECPWCGNRLEIQTSPSELEVIPVGDTEYKFDQDENEWILTVKTKTGKTARLGLARGFDEERLTIDQIRNINESSYEILGGCTRTFEGEPADASFYETYPNINDVDEILEEFIDNQPGPVTSLDGKCISCNRSFDFAVDPSDFLLPTVRQRRYRRRGKK